MLQDVHLIVVGSGTFARIKYDNGLMDVHLADGKRRADSLAQAAKELRDKAEQMLRRAAIMDEAAEYLGKEA